VSRMAQRLAPHGAINSLSQLLLKITGPGIPDIYQGTELWSFTLVDPDNRQLVDYGERQRLLEGIAELVDTPRAADVQALLESWEDGRIKLLVTTLALRCRSRLADAFDRGTYVRLEADGARAQHVFGFARQLDGDACIVVLPRWTTRLEQGALPLGRRAWAHTQLRLPPSLHGGWTNVLTGEQIEAAEALELSRVLEALPVAVLERR
jgi:(1->4)-alpha-D-glucan 1-alpha-D-glucosylmutase